MSFILELLVEDNLRFNSIRIIKLKINSLTFENSIPVVSEIKKTEN